MRLNMTDESNNRIINNRVHEEILHVYHVCIKRYKIWKSKKKKLKTVNSVKWTNPAQLLMGDVLK